MENNIIARMQSFKEWFSDFQENFVIIGGAACSLILNEEADEFRPTKDVDIVLLVEALNGEFGRQFWSYVLEAGYEHRQKSTDKPQFYRFYSPKTNAFPEMIELFSRHIDGLVLPVNAEITPMPIGEDISSLSAILLNDEYYNFLRDGVRRIDGFPVLDELHMIPFKAKAWLELTARRENGKSADSSDIRKHKRDVLRMADVIRTGFKITLPEAVKADMHRFITAVQETLPNAPPKERNTEQVLLKKIIEFFALPASLMQ
jgi:hypothetical protein